MSEGSKMMKEKGMERKEKKEKKEKKEVKAEVKV